VPDDEPVTPTVTTRRLHVLHTAAATLHVHVKNPSRSRVVVVEVQVGDRVEARTLATDSTKSATYDVDWEVGALPVGPGNVVVTAGYGDTVDAASTDQVRRVIPFQGAASTAKFLLPAQGAAFGEVNGEPGWIEVRSLPQLRVRLTG